MMRYATTLQNKVRLNKVHILIENFKSFSIDVTFSTRPNPTTSVAALVFRTRPKRRTRVDLFFFVELELELEL